MILNIFANILIVFGMTFLILWIFDKKNRFIQKLPIVEKLFLKFAVIVTGFGSIFNLLTFSKPDLSEIIQNIGFGLLFVWAALFHWRNFIKK